MKPVFSIIVPIYKVEKFLDKCIQSILNQTYDNFELILVDDGSPDNCPKICDEYAKKDKRIVVIHKKNGGLVSARNAGVEVATGEYICHVDGDDWVNEKMLEIIYDKAIKNNKVDMVVFGAIRQFNDRQEDIPNDVIEGLYNKERLQNEIYPFMMYDPRKSFCNGLIFPVAWNKVYKSELMKKHYCKDTRIRMGEDNAFVFECIIESKSIYFIKDQLYYYNQMNVGSITSNYDSNRFVNNMYMYQYMEERISGKNETIDLQFNAFKAYWLIMAIFHEVKCKQPIFKSRKHIKEDLAKTKTIKKINFKGLPIIAKCYIFLVKCHLYLITLLLSKIVAGKRN